MTKKIKPATYIFFALLFIWSGIIFAMSAQVADESSKTSSTVCEDILRIADKDFEKLSPEKQSERIESLQFAVRKTAHFSAYSLLGILAFLAFRSVGIKKYPIFSVGYCLVYAASDEFHQLFVEGRSGELRDVGIDFGGAVTGTAFIYLIILLAKRISKKRKARLDALEKA